MRFIQFAPLRALRAARVLAADPDDLPQVFTIIESLSVGTLDRMRDRYLATDVGRRLLLDKPDIVSTLSDRATLARLPEGSLGRAYLAFLERENISAEGIMSAAAEGMTADLPMPDDIRFLHERMRDTHDLWHAAVGYHGDVLGETALLAFSFAQTWNPGIALIIAIGLAKTIGFPEARAAILDGFRRGRKAAWLPTQDWESMLALPLEDVRRRLSLEEPPDYTPIRSSELKAAMAA